MGRAIRGLSKCRAFSALFRSVRASVRFFFPLAQIIVAGTRARAFGRGVGIEAGRGDGRDAAVLAHLQYFEPAAGATEHPMFAFELGGDPLDRALGAERLTAADAAERLLLFQQARRSTRGAEIELGRERDHLLRARRLTQPALHAGLPGKPQARAFGVVDQRAGWTSGYAGEAERAALRADLDGAERRAFRQRNDIDRRGRGMMKLPPRKAEK